MRWKTSVNMNLTPKFWGRVPMAASEAQALVAMRRLYKEWSAKLAAQRISRDIWHLRARRKRLIVLKALIIRMLVIIKGRRLPWVGSQRSLACKVSSRISSRSQVALRRTQALVITQVAISDASSRRTRLRELHVTQSTESWQIYPGIRSIIRAVSHPTESAIRLNFRTYRASTLNKKRSKEVRSLCCPPQQAQPPKLRRI